MTIKPFIMTDLGAFIPNEYSNPDEIFPLFMDARYEVHTMWGDDGLVQAIICFRNYWGNCWSCFVLIAKGFIPSNNQRLRDLIRCYMIQHNALRLETISRADEILRKWHQFLGFTHEGVKRKMMFNQDYDVWSIVREGV